MRGDAKLDYVDWYSEFEKLVTMIKREKVIAHVMETGKPCEPVRKHFFAKTTCKICGTGPCYGPVEKFDSL